MAKSSKKLSGKKTVGKKVAPKKGAAKHPKPDKTTQQDVRRIRPDNPKTDKNADGKPDEVRESMTPHKGPDKKPKGPQWSKPNEIDNDTVGRPNDRVQTDDDDELDDDVMADDPVESLGDDDDDETEEGDEDN